MKKQAEEEEAAKKRAILQMEEDERLARAMAEQASSDSASSEGGGGHDDGASEDDEEDSVMDSERMAAIEQNEPAIVLEREVFNRESFKRLISRTFDDYYPMEFNNEHFNLDSYLTLVAEEQLEAKFGVYLEQNGENVLTLKNMPWLDIGDLPQSYSPGKSEAFQVYMTPAD